jgi:hypothetical protein
MPTISSNEGIFDSDKIRIWNKRFGQLIFKRVPGYVLARYLFRARNAFETLQQIIRVENLSLVQLETALSVPTLRGAKANVEEEFASIYVNSFGSEQLKPISLWTRERF